MKLLAPAVTALLLAQAGQEPHADRPGESGLVERVDVSLVRVDIRAVDRSGRPVADLTADEIRVRHGKRDLEVAYLERVETGAVPAYARLSLEATAGDVRTAETGEGRTTVVLFDLLNTVPLTRERARRDLASWLKGGAPAEDRIGLATAEADFRWRVPPTRDRKALLEALADDAVFDRPEDDPLPGLYRDLQIDRMSGAAGRGEEAALMGTARCETLALVTMESLRSAVDLLAPLDGTKDIVLVSEGFPVSCPNSTLSKETLFDLSTPYRDGEPNELRYRFPIRKGQVRYRVDPRVSWSGIRGTFDRLLDAAARARVSFLTVHPRSVGRFAGGSEIASFQSTSLNALSRHTGGEHFSGGNIRKSLQRARDSQEGSYELGFYRPGDGSDAPPREIEIETTRRKTRIHHRRARGGDVPAELRESGALELGRPGLRDGGHQVALTVDPGSFRFVPAGKGRPTEARFSIGLSLLGEDGSLAASALFEVTLSSRDRPPGSGAISYRVRIDAPPGSYRLTARLAEPAGGALDDDAVAVTIPLPETDEV